MVSSPGCSRIVPAYQLSTDFIDVFEIVIAYIRSYIARTFDRQLTARCGGIGDEWKRFECRAFQEAFRAESSRTTYVMTSPVPSEKSRTTFWRQFARAVVGMLKRYVQNWNP
jgi:hypothetical protein